MENNELMVVAILLALNCIAQLLMVLLCSPKSMLFLGSPWSWRMLVVGGPVLVVLFFILVELPCAALKNAENWNFEGVWRRK